MNLKKVNEIIEQKGFRKGFIAKKIGVSSSVLVQRLTGQTQFKASELAKMKDALGLSDLEWLDIILDR